MFSSLSYSCVTLAKAHNLSVPRFLLKKGKDNGIYLIELLKRLYKLIYEKVVPGTQLTL